MHAKAIASILVASLCMVSFFMPTQPQRVQAEDMPTFEPQSSDWWNTNWSFSKQITINHSQVADNLTNFPICINITDSDLATNAQTDGDDIIFTADNISKFNHEIELYNSTSGQLVAWVNITELSGSSDTTIWMYYGNATCSNQENGEGVWDSDYTMVYHFVSTTDSTSNSHDLTNSGCSFVNGNIGVEATLDGSSLTIPDIFNTYGGDFTFTAYFNTGSSTSGYLYDVKGADPDNYFGPAGDSGFRWRNYKSGGIYNNLYSTTVPNTNTYYGLSCAHDSAGDYKYIFINGTQENSASFSGITLDSTTSNTIGSSDFDSITEFRFSTTMRSNTYISTTYNSMNNATEGGFFTMGDEQTQGNQFTAWEYNRSITFNSSQIPSNLINFPVCINITDTHLKNNAQADGDDILFTADNITKLNHEIELYNSTTGHLVAWVNITSLSSTEDTTIWMYYGNATCNNQENVADTWNNNYVMIQHFDEIEIDGTVGDIKDSLGNENGTSKNLDNTDVVNGRIGNAFQFDGTNEFIETKIDAGNYNLDEENTVELWIYPEYDFSSGQRKFFGKFEDQSDRFYFGIDGPDWKYGYGDDTHYHSHDISRDKWHYSTFCRDENNNRCYTNASLKGTGSTGWGEVTDYYPYIGCQNTKGSPDQYFPGKIDELRISDTARSADWITVTYNTMNNATDGGFFELEPTGPTNTAPNTPTSPQCQNITNPDHLTDHTPYFDWVFSDSDTNDTQHGFQIQVGNDPDWGTVEMWNYQENTSNNFTTYNGSPLQDGDTYYWRVRVKDNDSAWSDYTSNQQFRMNSVPSIPTLNSPANNAHNMSYTTNSINLSWYEATDAESDSPNYWWQYSRADDFSLMSTEADGDEGWSTGPTWEWIPNQGELIERTDYYWRVKSWDGLEFSGWSNVRTFETDEKIDLTDLSISDNATGVSINITEWSINITHDEATLFKWWINTTPDIGNASGFNADDGIKTCQLSGLQYNTSYEVQVVVIGSSRNETYTFTTEEDPGDNIHVTLSPQAEASIEVNRSAWEPNIGITGDIKTDPVWGLLDNNGSITVDVTVNVSNTLNWTAAPTAAHNQFQMQIHNSSWYTIDNTHQTFVENLAYNEDQTFGLQLFMPTSSETNTNQTATITFVATAD